MQGGSNKPKFSFRYYFVWLVIGLVLCALIWRVVDLTVIDRNFLQRQGDARSVRTITIPAYRGMITDRHGEPLAVSTPVESIWVNPKEFSLDDKNLSKLADLIQVSVDAITQKVNANQHKEFVYLKRSMNPALAKQIKKLELKGVHLQREFRRFYPTSEVAAHVIGFTNIDDHGQEGIELAYNSWLEGKPGKRRVIKNRLGQVVDDLGVVEAPDPGRNIALSIDRQIQYLAYRELKSAIDTTEAKSGSVIVLDSNTGEILAMVNMPSYNPNQRLKTAKDGRYRNRGVTDILEPGSVIKAFSVASALQTGEFSSDTVIDTHPSPFIVAGHPIRDTRLLGKVTVTEVLMRSSNIGVSKMTLALPPENLWGAYHKLGFGEITKVQFPGERSGSLVKHRRWNPFVLATLSFGYGLSVTPLQIAQAYTTFANEGKMVYASLLRHDNPPKTRQIFDKQTAQEVLTMLHEVVDGGGSGKKARVPGIRVAGKTGTTRVVGENGYDSTRHISSFAGLAPVNKPRLVVLVVINEPKKGYYGGAVAAPVFSRIMAGSLRILGVKPGKI